MSKGIARAAGPLPGDLMPITYEDENEDYAEKPSIHVVDRAEMAS